MKKILLIISILLISISNFAAEFMAGYGTIIRKRDLCLDYFIGFYDNNCYEISVKKCSMYRENIKDTVISKGTFVLKGEIIILTDVVTKDKIQLRYIFEERRLKTENEVIKVPRLKVEQGIKELNGDTLNCSPFDIFIYPPKPKPKSKLFSGVYHYDYTCYISFFESGCYEIQQDEREGDGEIYSRTLSRGTFELKGNTIILTEDFRNLKIQLRRFDGKIKVEQGFPYLEGKVFDYHIDNDEFDCENEIPIYDGTPPPLRWKWYR